MTPAGKNWLIAGLVLIVLTGVFFAGWFAFAKTHPPPVFTSSHTVVYDTASKHIYHIYPWYVEKLVSVKYRDQAWIDSIKNANQLDSAGIKYYASYQYERTISDTSLTVKWTDVISQNKAMPMEGFTYNWNKPLTVIENVLNETNYNKYLYVGGSIPLYDAKMANLGFFYAFKGGLAGIGYSPYKNGVTITGGFTLFKIK